VLLFLFERIGPAEQAYERPWGEPLKKPSSGSRHGNQLSTPPQRYQHVFYALISALYRVFERVQNNPPICKQNLRPTVHNLLLTLG
jgi:hypothetical protein